MHVLISLTAYLLCTAHAAPQFVTFKDGKIGVNFGGYHAEAGLGGLLTGNAAHGGLSASAGTPWGQNAAAGLGGAVDGRSSGFGYAGAQAIPSVGASAAFGGTAGENGFIGSEAHANGKIHSKTIISAAQPMNEIYEHHSINPVTSGPIPALESRLDVIQKIKPPKKYTLIKNEHSVNTDVNAIHSKHITKNFHKSVNTQADAPAPNGPKPDINVHYNANPGMLGNILNIPIGILRTIQESLTGVQIEKNVAISG